MPCLENDNTVQAANCLTLQTFQSKDFDWHCCSEETKAMFLSLTGLSGALKHSCKIFETTAEGVVGCTE
jgi:hypothetical protein